MKTEVFNGDYGNAPWLDIHIWDGLRLIVVGLRWHQHNDYALITLNEKSDEGYSFPKNWIFA